MEMRREEVALQDGTIFFERKKNTTRFYLIFTKIYSRKNQFGFSKQNTYKLKDLKLL